MTQPSLRVVYMGTPEFAVPTLETLLGSGHTVCGVVTQPDRPRGRGQQVRPGAVKALALSHGLPVLQPERLGEPGIHDALRAWAPDLGVVAAYGRLIPESMLTLPRLGMINVHASLLPRWRGAAPVHRAIIAGDADTGVTIMRVVKALDEGGMFARVVRPIGPDETSDAVERDLAKMGAALLLSVVDALAAGIAVEQPQDAVGITYAARLRKDEGLLDWRRPARDLHNHVRGLHPWPLACSYLCGRRVIIRRTRQLTGSTADAPGTIVQVSSAGLEVATGQGCLLIEEIQPEGRRPMHVRDFLAGHAVRVGDGFDSGPGASPAPAGTV